MYPVTEVICPSVRLSAATADTLTSNWVPGVRPLMFAVVSVSLTVSVLFPFVHTTLKKDHCPSGSVQLREIEDVVTSMTFRGPTASGSLRENEMGKGGMSPSIHGAEKLSNKTPSSHLQVVFSFSVVFFVPPTMQS